jgi:hypothetical protein
VPLPPKEMGIIPDIAVLLDAAARAVDARADPAAPHRPHRPWLRRWLDRVIPDVRVGH